jgi:hypothetical protein
MIPVGDHYARIIFFNRDNDRLAVCQWINFAPIYNGAQFEKTKQELVFSLNDYMKGCAYISEFM